MKIAKHLTELVGNTPLLELTNYELKNETKATLIGKLEYFNPLGSAKDRVALEMIEEGFQNGTINKDTVIIEPTSGNTGIGLAFVTASKGMKLILTMPDTMSIERQKIVKALGAEVILTPGSLGMKGAIDKANELQKTLPNAVITQQFENTANPEAHRKTTAREILEDTEGKIDFFVAGVGTGGTLTGNGEVIKEAVPTAKIIAVEPFGSPVLSKGVAGKHGLMGIGAGFVPKILNREIIDEIITVKDEEAYETARTLAHTDGVLIGISGGAALYAATQIAKRPENEGKRIVVLLPDSGERYLSTSLFV